MELIFYFLLCFCYVCVDFAHSEMYYIPQIDPDLKLKTTDDTLPWMGVLRMKNKPGQRKAEFISEVILIAKKFAIGSADDISKIRKDRLKKSTLITFFDYELIPWNCFALDYLLHPEYGDETVNTIALIKLDTVNDMPSFMWQPVQWPKNFYGWGNYTSVYNVEYTDRELTLQQIIKRVRGVTLDKCTDFYKREGMDFKKIWPTHFKCFRVVGDHQSCVYNAGMAVASNDSGKWTLIGVGTYGPGCSFPARFIEFFPYIPWIKSSIERTSPRDEVVYSRRNQWDDVDMDSSILGILYDRTIEIIPQMPKVKFWSRNRYLTCPGRQEIIYHEEGRIKVNSPTPSATVFFSVSLFDDKYGDIECIRIFVDCVQKTEAEVLVQRGFGQEDLEPLIKQIVMPLPYIGLGDKILYITDHYRKYDKKQVTTLWFKFIFIWTGRIDIIFYGSVKPPTTTTEAPTTSRPATTTPWSGPRPPFSRDYATYLNWNIYKVGG